MNKTELEQRVKRLERELKSLNKRVSELSGDDAEPSSNPIADLIIDAVATKKHELFSCDLLTSREIAFVMNLIYPDDVRFKLDVYNVKQVNAKAAVIGKALSRSKHFKSLFSQYHLSAKETESGKPHNFNTRLWVLRNYNKYKDYSRGELRELQFNLWKDAHVRYNEMSGPSFM